MLVAYTVRQLLRLRCSAYSLNKTLQELYWNAEGFFFFNNTHERKKDGEKLYSVSRILILGQTVAVIDTSMKTYRTGSYAFQFSYVVLFCNICTEEFGPSGKPLIQSDIWLVLFWDRYILRAKRVVSGHWNRWYV